MSVKEIKSYEFQCDICKIHKLEPSNLLPAGWYKIAVSVWNNPKLPYDGYRPECKYVPLRETKKTIHICEFCGNDPTKDVFVRPAELFNEEG